MIDSQQPTVQPQVDFLQIQPQVGVSKQARRPTQVELIKSIEAQKPSTTVRQVEAQKSIQRQAQEQMLNLESSQLFRQPTTPSQPTQPRPPTPIPLFGDTSPAVRAVKQLAKQVKGDFEVFARVGGEDISIGKAKTLKKAAKKLSKKLKGTLSASGFLEEGGKRLSAIETGLIDGDFRVGRLDITRVVQKKSTRLGTGQETSEIQFFRTSKGGSSNLLGGSSSSLLGQQKKRRRSKNGFSFL